MEEMNTTVEMETMDTADTATEVVATDNAFLKALGRAGKWVGKKVIGAVIIGGIGGAAYHYTEKHLTKRDEEKRIKAAADAAAKAEKEKIEAEKKAASSTVETSDEGQKVLAETAE